MSAVDRITELMLRVGDAQAARAANGGNVWGKVAVGLGDLARQHYAQGLQEKELAAQQQARDLSMSATRQSMDFARQGNEREGAALALKQRDAVMGEAGNRLHAILSAPPELKPALFTAYKRFAVGNKIHTPDEIPDAYPGDDVVKAELTGVAGPQAAPKAGAHVVESALVDDAGKVLYTAPPKPTGPGPNPTEASLAMAAQSPDPTVSGPAKAALATLRGQHPPASSAGAGPSNDVQLAVQGMKEGTLPPQMPGRASKDYTAIMAEAKRQGYDLASAATDWQATQKHIATLNGAQQLRLNQSISALPDLLDSVDALAAKWKAGRFPLLNKANLALAKGGAFGKDAASVANQLDAQIADVVSDLGNVYMGGNSPTDHALSLASKSLSADWDAKVLHDMVTLAKNNVTVRLNSIRNVGVQGASANNPYAPPAQPVAPPQSTGAPSYQDYLKSRGHK